MYDPNNYKYFKKELFLKFCQGWRFGKKVEMRFIEIKIFPIQKFHAKHIRMEWTSWKSLLIVSNFCILNDRTCIKVYGHFRKPDDHMCMC